MGWLLLANLFTILLFWTDKRRARHGLRRIPELRLLMLALLGGTPAAYLSRRLFRHKTRKQPFSSRLGLILMSQLLLLGVTALTLGRDFA